MENFVKYSFSATAGMLSIFAPIKALVMCAVIFVAIDFVTGVMASRKRAKKRGEPWAFESSRAWRTITKALFIMAGIVMAWMIDSFIVPFWNLKLANIYTGFVCAVEFWSYLENAAEISEHPIFRKLKKYMKKELEQKMEE